MNLKNICGEHTVDTDLLTGGWILDIGCRGFEFSKSMLEFSSKIIAIDAGKDVVNPNINGIMFEKIAIVHNDTIKTALFSDWGNGTGSHLVLGRTATHGSSIYLVDCSDIKSIMNKYNITQFDLIKIDCEGSEYEILLNWVGPISKQISVEFHDFLGVNPRRDPNSYYTDMLNHLSQWYFIVQHEKSKRYDISYENYWDSLFILK